VERHRIERVIRLLGLEISPATRASPLWILIERQTERTRVLLKYLAKYPEQMLKDVETKFISWGYLPGKAHCYELSIVVEGRNRIEERIGMKSRRVELCQYWEIVSCVSIYRELMSLYIENTRTFPRTQLLSPGHGEDSNNFLGRSELHPGMVPYQLNSGLPSLLALLAGRLRPCVRIVRCTIQPGIVILSLRLIISDKEN